MIRPWAEIVLETHVRQHLGTLVEVRAEFR